MKNGIRTTEFWLGLFASIVGPVLAVLVATGRLSPDLDPAGTGAELTQHVTSLVEAVVALVGAVTPLFVARSYTAARAEVKIAASAQTPSG